MTQTWAARPPSSIEMMYVARGDSRNGRKYTCKVDAAPALVDFLSRKRDVGIRFPAQTGSKMINAPLS